MQASGTSGWPLGLDSTLKAGGAIGAASYVFGMVVVNSYLYDLGVSDFTLVRPRFIVAGLLFLLPIATICSATIFAIARLDEAMQGNLWVGFPNSLKRVGFKDWNNTFPRILVPVSLIVALALMIGVPWHALARYLAVVLALDALMVVLAWMDMGSRTEFVDDEAPSYETDDRSLFFWKRSRRVSNLFALITIGCLTVGVSS